MSITGTDVQSINFWVDEVTASRIADLWNTAYPGMRADLTAEIKRVTPLAETADDADGRWKGHILRAKKVRKELAQLDNGTYRGCTRSPGGFSTYGALTAASDLMNMRAGRLTGPNAGNVFRLLAELADTTAARDAQLASQFPEFAPKSLV